MKMWFIYIMEYCSVVKNEILNFAGKWMEDHIEWGNPNTERKMLHVLSYLGSYLQMFRYEYTSSSSYKHQETKKRWLLELRSNKEGK